MFPLLYADLFPIYISIKYDILRKKKSCLVFQTRKIVSPSRLKFSTNVPVHHYTNSVYTMYT